MRKLDLQPIVLTAFWFSTAFAATAQTLTTLASFPALNGYPSAGLVQGRDGDFYGATEGTTWQQCNPANTAGCGSVFKVTPGGVLTTLYTFCSQPGCTDGAAPFASLLQASNGVFYGTTQFGGDFSCPLVNGCGTVFEITAEGVLATLHTFTGHPDGAWPLAGLMQANNGYLYGTASDGAIAGAECGGRGCGMVYQMSLRGDLTPFYRLCQNDPDSCGVFSPEASLIQATDGRLYTTVAYGTGSILELGLNGNGKNLAGMTRNSGAHPQQPLVQAADGNFYGMTPDGAPNKDGAVFKVTPAGELTVLHIFGGPNDGQTPWGGLIQANDGNLYGLTKSGGTLGGGIIFKITTDGKETILYNLGLPGPVTPECSLFQGTDGKLYGTTTGGGAYGGGTAFSFDIGLSPLVIPNPVFGKPGAKISILGTNLTGAAAVTFNGTAAEFTVSSPSLITATVPEGAATGIVQVTTPGGVLSGNGAFQVLP